MNIFMTDSDPKQAAYDHCVVHRNKMIIEVSQMLCTAHRLLDGEQAGDQRNLYKATHINHPCAVFVRSSADAYNWTYEHLRALHTYYYHHRAMRHASLRLLPALSNYPNNISHEPSFKPVVAAPSEFKVLADRSDVVTAYRAYMNWKLREWIHRDRPMKVEWPYGKPYWLDNDIN